MSNNNFSKIPVPLVMLCGTIGVIFFSFFHWVVGANPYTIVFELSSFFNFLTILFLVLFLIVLLLSFAVLIYLLFKPQIKERTTIAIYGFGLNAFASFLFIMVISIAIAWRALEPWPFISLLFAVAAIVLIYLVKQPQQQDFKNALEEMKQIVKRDIMRSE